MRCGNQHKELKDGVGKCSVPMWQMGIPAGYCGKSAYGEPTKEGRRRYGKYVPFLACYYHGGPKNPVVPHENDKLELCPHCGRSEPAPVNSPPPLMGWVSLELLRDGPPFLVKSEAIFGNEVKVKVTEVKT